MRIFSKLLVLGAALAVSSSMAYADTLGNGTINFFGSDAYTSHSITFYGTQYVGGLSTGSLSSFAAGEVANFTNLSSFTTLPSTPFFSVNNGTDTLKFTLTSVTSSMSSAGLTLLGDGYFTEVADAGGATLFTSTPGTIDLTTQGGSITTFSASSSITPEPTSLLLLGTGLLSAAGVARRKFASKLV